MRKKILVVSSTSEHLINFHIPYIEDLKKDYDVYIMAKNVGNKFSDFDINFEKKLFTINHFKVIKQIKKILLQEKFYAIFLNTSLAAFLVRLALKGIKDRPIVINIVHGYLFSNRSSKSKAFWFKFAEKLVKKQTDYIIVMNEEDKDIATKYKLCLKDIFKINGMGIHENRFIGIPQKKSDDDSISFAFIGELSNRKNQKFLISFIDKLNKFNIHSTLKLVGDGSNKNKLKNLICKKGLENQVFLVGYDSDVENQIIQCDYYICSSKIEGMPFNIIEAMYCKAVVFSSDIKGSVDLIDDLENGVLFKLGDMNNLINKFRLINNNLNLQNKLRKNAYKTAQKYLLNNVFDENIKLFRKLIEG